VPVAGIAKMIDLQSTVSTHQIYLNQVGIRAIKHPISIRTQNNGIQNCVATFNMSVSLAADKRGTHMSRFVEVLNLKPWELSVSSMQEMLALTSEKFKTDSVSINAKFDLFLNKTAPVSGAMGLMDYQAEITGEFKTNKNQTHTSLISLTVTVPVTTLCPCSKEISEYGAHNQRSHIKLKVTTDQTISYEQLISLVESEASCEIYSVLKRADEKYVTERAYNNPRFVEDIVRNIAHRIDTHQTLKVSYYKVESENFESIHNHSAYAMLEK
jgi:GTP cyclohydrolase I